MSEGSTDIGGFAHLAAQMSKQDDEHHKDDEAAFNFE
jgi:hypothetical protein